MKRKIIVFSVIFEMFSFSVHASMQLIDDIGQATIQKKAFIERKRSALIPGEKTIPSNALNNLWTTEKDDQNTVNNLWRAEQPKQ